MPADMWGVLVQIGPETLNHPVNRVVHRHNNHHPADVRVPEPRQPPRSNENR